VSRQVNLVNSPAVLTVGRFIGGIRYNIIPDSVFLEGTIRTFDPAQRDTIVSRLKRTAQGIAQSAGAEATVIVGNDPNPATINDAALYRRMLPTLQRVAGSANVHEATPSTTAEDFSYYLKEVPGIFYFLGTTPRDRDPETAAKNHSPKWYLDESAMPLGVRSLANMAVDYLSSAPASARR
jgi:amidohydrolase